MRAALRMSLQRLSGAGALAALILILLAAPRHATAQNAASAQAVAVRTAYLGQLDELQTKFLQLAEAFPAEKYSWRPAPGVRSVGEVFKHVAIEYYMYDPMAFRAAPSPAIGHGPDASQKFETASTKPEAIQALKDGFTYAKQVIGAVSPDSLTGTRKMFGRDFTLMELSYAMSGDLHEHLGQLIAYARVNGIKPPWSK